MVGGHEVIYFGTNHGFKFVGMFSSMCEHHRVLPENVILVTFVMCALAMLNFNFILGYQDTIRSLKECVMLPLLYPEIIDQLGTLTLAQVANKSPVNTAGLF